MAPQSVRPKRAARRLFTEREEFEAGVEGHARQRQADRDRQPQRAEQRRERRRERQQEEANHAFIYFASLSLIPPSYLFSNKGHALDLRAQARYRRQGLEWDPITVVDYFELPGMEVDCRHCGAILFRAEPEGICCLKGIIVLPHVVDAPEPLTQAFLPSWVKAICFFLAPSNYH